MIRVATFLAAIALALTAAPSSLMAQEPAPAIPQEGGYSRLLDSLLSDEVVSAAADSTVRAMLRLILDQNPELAEISASSPGFDADFIGRFHPVFVEHVRNLNNQMKEPKIAILKTAMSSQEADRLASFYATPLGQRLMTGTVRSNNYDRTLSAENLDETLTAENLSADLHDAAIKSVREQKFSLAEQRDLLKLSTDPAFLKMQSVMGEIQAVTVEYENRPIPPETEQKLTKVLLSILEDYIEE